MIKLLYNGQNDAIHIAIKKSNEILQSDAFYEKVASLPQMSNTHLCSEEIALILKENNQQITIGTFWNPFSSQIKIKQPCIFNVNTYKFSCITAFAVNTLINESLLSVSTKCEGLVFEKIDYDEMEYPNAFPWRVGEIAEILTRKKKLAALNV
jgi:hypothetical protein